MSEFKYKESEDVPTSELCSRLDALSDAVTKGRDAINREFYMSIPARVERDADIVLCQASMRLSKLEKERDELRKKNIRLKYVSEIYREAWDKSHPISWIVKKLSEVSE